ncbi:MAG: PilN domain-containing protein [Geminicoccaceae bacterium]
MSEHLSHVVRRVPADLWHWWTAELTGIIPWRWRATPSLSRPNLLLSLRPDETVLVARSKSGDIELDRSDGSIETALNPLGDWRYRRWPIVIELDDALGLSKVVDLPLAGRDDLDRLLHYELDRLTPFKPDDVCFAWQIVEQRSDVGRMKIRLEMAQRLLIEEASSHIRKCGREPARIQLKGDAERQSLDLKPTSLEKAGRVPGLPFLVIGLAVIALATPLWQQHVRIQRLEPEIESARSAAEESAALKDQIAALVDQANFLIETKKKRASMTSLLKTLTALIPDHAYVTQLAIEDDQITFVGRADKASDLLSVLDASPVFASPRFRSPVTRDPSTQKERFQIAAEIVEGGS